MKTHFIASGFELTTELERYAQHKLIEIGRRVPRSVRAGVSCTIHFDQKHKKEDKISTCTVVLVLPDTELHTRETTSHMYAALDIAVVNINQQLRDYAARNRVGGLRGHLHRRPKTEE
jgi:ribosomal subunit interface protein